MNPSTDLERLAQLERLVLLAGAMKKGVDYQVALSRATEEVRESAEVPERLDKIEPVLDALGRCAGLPAQDLKGEFATLAKAGRDLERAVDTLALRDARYPLQEAEKSVGKLESLVARAWSEQIKAEFGPLRQLGALLADIPDTRDSGRKLKTWADQALALVTSTLPSKADVDRFQQAQSQIPSQLAGLEQLGIDEKVRQFVGAVAAGSATLNDLHPDVLAWLKRMRADGRFRVVLG